MRLVYDFLSALQFLTRIPVPRFPFTSDSLPRSAKFFPLVGLLVGALAAAIHSLLAPHLPRLATATLTITCLVLLTGAFHEDGLADIADGFGGGWTRDRVLDIMRDSRIGTYGGAALALSLFARVTLLSAIPLEHVTRALIAAHILCRWTTLPLSYLLPPARPAGDGQATTLTLSSGTVALSTALTFAATILALGWRALPVLLLAGVVTLLSGLYYRHRIGGVTGDCFGATNQLTEVAVYLVAAWA